MYLCSVNLPLSDFLKLRNELPTVDVRSEGEFAAGHIKGAFNIPILNNAERVAVGTDYKKKGQLEAIKTGFRLVGPRIHDIVVQAEELAAEKELLVHCWRGGMRSSNFCQFVGMAKIKSHQLIGGYKAYRAEAIKTFSSDFKFIVLSGYTGSGKSEVLRALKENGEQVIDLEQLANHKGSVFGGFNMPAQPTTEQFQNDLFEDLLRLDVSRRIWIEDESITIGQIVLPEPFWRSMTRGSVVKLDVAKDVRLERLVHEYGNIDEASFLKAMTAISRKLGGQHFQAAKEYLLGGDRQSTIDILLNYYDNTYRNSINKRKDNVTSEVTWDGADLTELVKSLKSIVS